MYLYDIRLIYVQYVEYIQFCVKPFTAEVLTTVLLLPVQLIRNG